MRRIALFNILFKKEEEMSVFFRFLFLVLRIMCLYNRTVTDCFIVLENVRYIKL